MGQPARKPAEPRPYVGLSDVDVAARGICMAHSARQREPCGCERGGPCHANESFATSALGAVSALRVAERLPPLPANRPCIERGETGSCLACDAPQGSPCQHPSLKL